MTRYLCIAALLAGATIAPAAVAQERSVMVEYSDLNLTTDKGVQVLDRRIAFAVQKVCGVPHALDLEEQAWVRNCRGATFESIGEARQEAIRIAQLRRGERVASRMAVASTGR